MDIQSTPLKSSVAGEHYKLFRRENPMNKSSITKSVAALFSLIILAACSGSPAEPTSEATIGPQSFNTFGKWHDSFCSVSYCDKGDVNGDGKDDVVTFSQGNGWTYVALSNGSSFPSSLTRVWTFSGCAGGQACRMGDVNGDGRDDAIIFERNNENSSLHGDVYVQLSVQASRFAAKQKWHDNFCTGGEGCYVADINGDGKDDILSFAQDRESGKLGDVYAALSNSVRFGTRYTADDYFCASSVAVCDVGDFNGDRKDDIVAFYRNAPGTLRGDVYVALSQGFTYAPQKKWADGFCLNQETCAVGDVSGSTLHFDDIIAFVHADSGSGGTNSRVKTAQSIGFSFGAAITQLGGFCFFKDSMCMAGNFNGSGKEDLVWFVRNTIPGARAADVYVAESQ
jgi:FG-GAP-like repeat